MKPGIEKDSFNSVPCLQATCLLNSHHVFFFPLFFLQRVSPVIRARLEQFDFPLFAFKPGCELSKAASKALVKTQRGGSKAPQARELCGWKGWWTGAGAFSRGCLETRNQVVMEIDKATHVREGQSAERDESGCTRRTWCIWIWSRKLFIETPSDPIPTPQGLQVGDILASSAPPTFQFNDKAFCCSCTSLTHNQGISDNTAVLPGSSRGLLPSHQVIDRRWR